MITIKQILEWPVGYKSGGFVLTVKKVKKFWELPQADGTLVGHKGEGRIIIHQAVLTDGTGDLLCDLQTNSPEHGNHNPLKVGQMIRIIVCEVQKAYEKKGTDPEPDKKLFIEQYEDYIKQEVRRGESPWGPDSEAFEWAEARKEEVKGKIRHGIVCAMIKSPAGRPKARDPETERYINAWVEFIVTGK
jgi:hypothetical protein